MSPVFPAGWGITWLCLFMFRFCWTGLPTLRRLNTCFNTSLCPSSSTVNISLNIIWRLFQFLSFLNLILLWKSCIVKQSSSFYQVSEQELHSPNSVQQAGAWHSLVSVSTAFGHSRPPLTGPMQSLDLVWVPCPPQDTLQSVHSVRAPHE